LSEALSYAVSAFVAKGAAVYIDAGHGNWGKNPALIAQYLVQAGVKNARGISVNVSNYQTTDDSAAYAREILQLLGGGGAVIDTSRNGVGPTPDNEWCNAPGRKLGISPRVSSDTSIDAYLWIKYPGESDGSCGGGTPEGTWWQDYALGLAS
jgi:endoglucanase